MSRGLGRRQRAVLAALRQLEGKHGPGWRSPADVVALIAPDPVAIAPEPSGEERMIRSQLAGCRELVALGHREYEAGLMLAEARLAQIAAARPKVRPRAPNQIRSVPRGGESSNPSRTFALLARRGLVERQARCGPGSAVRLVEGG